MEESKYYRFPVALLKDGSTDLEADSLFQRIITYCVGDFSLNVAPSLENSYEIAEQENESQGYCLELEDDEEINLLVAAKFLGVKLGSANNPSYYHKTCGAQPHGKMFVVFPRDPFWRFKESSEDSADEFRKFLILCGVLAGIGNASYKKLQYDRIGAIASGYSSSDEFKRFNGKLRFTRDQVRWTVDKLEQIKFESGQGWFVRCPMNRRHMYYSTKLNLAQLQAELVKLGVTKQRTAQMSQRKESVQQMIQTEIKRLDLIEKMKCGGAGR